MKKIKKYKSKFEEKAPRIVKHVLTGIYKYAKTFGIITAENPMGLKISRDENKRLNKEFHDLLSRGGYTFTKVKGKYGNIENPVLILNITLKDLKKFGDLYNQESVIYGEVNDYRDVTFEYWIRDNEKSPLKFKDSIDHIDVLQDPDDFYTRIKNWKFNIPFPIFQESLISWAEKVSFLKEESKKLLADYVEDLIENEDIYTGHKMYNIRGKIKSLFKGI